jgi:hypothetical protein
VSFSVQESGSRVQGIDAKTFEDIVTGALETWASADCGGGRRPSFVPASHGSVVCAEPEYNSNGQNASVFMFRDDAWPYQGADALGRTTLRFDQATGELFDADVEINAMAVPLRASDAGAGADLLSIVMHEAGHFLGIGHTDVSGAVMYPGYAAGDGTRRELAPDDVAAICAAFPPGRQVESTTCEPRHGFSPLCLVEQPPPDESLSENRNAPGCSVHGGSVIARRTYGESLLLLGGMLVAARFALERLNAKR